MRVIFLGTNGWYDTVTGNTVSIAIDGHEYTIILDAGSGLAKLDHYLALDRPTYLFVSHLHLDHLIGLHMVSAFDFQKGLTILGGEGTEEALRRLLDSPFTVPVKNYRFATRFVDLPGGEEALPFGMVSLSLEHTVPTRGYRFEFEGSTIAYVPDTGYCGNAVELARGADLLIAECAYRPGEEDPRWPHLNPGSAARIAVEGGAKRLMLVHFDARLYGSMKERKEAEAAARKIFPGTTATEDGMIVEV